MKSRWKKFFTGAGILGLCTALAKLLGAFFRIPLTNIVGAEGIGLYQMVFPLYTVLLTISSGGIATAVSKAVASSRAKGETTNTLSILKITTLSILLFAAAASLPLILFNRHIASVQGNSLAALAYLGIAPSIVFVAVVAAFRGYFQGNGNMLPSGVSQIIEQAVKLGVGLSMAAFLMPRGLEWAVFGAVLGVTVSELLAMIFLLASFLILRQRHKKRNLIYVKNLPCLESGIDECFKNLKIPHQGYEKKPISKIMKMIYAIAVPVTLGSLIMPLTQVIDSVMIINVLVSNGAARGEATALFGLISGPIASLINMPMAITLAISVALLPKIAAYFSKNKEAVVYSQDLRSMSETAEDIVLETKQNSEKAAVLVGKSIFLTLLLSLPAAAIFMFFSNNIVGALYSRGLSDVQIAMAARLLRIESLSIIYLGIIQVATAVLQGADKPHRPAINLLYGAIAKVLLTLILLPFIGIVGAAIATVVCYGIVALINFFYMKKVVSIKFNLFWQLFMPLIACVLMIASAKLVLFLLGGILNQLIAFIISLLAGGLVYAAFLFITKTVKIKELLS
ncbi:MAG: polysaccharide biosynthesis protein [Firmicutes bacterium]|nr:polysaccharide biosynthesis protein [Bacillota bacterium]